METSRLFRVEVEGERDLAPTCDVEVLKATGTSFRPHGFFHQMQLFTTNTLSRLEPGEYVLKLANCEPTTHRPIPARLRFHVPAPGTDTSPSHASYDVGCYRMVQQSQLRRFLASACASATAIAPSVGSAAATLLFMLVLAVGVVLTARGGGGGGSSEELSQEEGEKSEGPPASNSKGVEIVSTEVPAPVELPSTHGGSLMPECILLTVCLLAYAPPYFFYFISSNS